MLNLSGYGRTNTKGNRPRDTQRKKLYAAERALENERPSLEQVTMPQLEDVQRYVTTTLKSPWTQREFRTSPSGRMPLDIRVKDGRGSSSARAGYTSMHIPKWARNKFSVLHELAHCLTPSRYAWHGREYAANYLKLVRHFMGVEIHDALRTQFKAHKVKYLPKRTRSVYQRTGNLAALAKARAAKLAKAARPQEPIAMRQAVAAAHDFRLDVALARANGC